jgi:hypothetical protein
MLAAVGIWILVMGIEWTREFDNTAGRYTLGVLG